MPTQLSGYQVRLNTVAEEHLDQLREWRNSDHVKQYMLTQDLITPEQQKAWFAHLSRATNQHHYVIEYRGELIGSCNIKTRGHAPAIKEAEHFEIGLYIGDPQFMGNLIAFAPTLVLNDYCFERLNATSLHAVVKPENNAALRYNYQLGYTAEQTHDVIELVLTHQQYQENTQTLKKLLSRNRRKVAGKSNE